MARPLPSAPASDAAVRPHPAAPRAARVALDEEQFARDVSLMLLSGLTLMEALRTLQERGGAGGVLEALMRRLSQGESLATAMQASPAFRPALLACVRASETTGDLPDSLARYAAHAARLRQLRARIVSALVYPAVLIAVAAAVVVFLLVFVVPRFAMVLETSGKDLPAASRALITVGRALHEVPAWGWGALALAAAWVLWAAVDAWRAGRLEAALGDLAARLPGLRGLVRAFGHARFARSAAMLVRAGVPAIKALAMCRALLAGADRVALDRALVQARGGAPLAGALAAQDLVDGLGQRVLRVAEQTGALDLALDRLADVHDQALERTLERVGRLIEPVLMLFIGLVIGGIVVLMYLPIFQLAASL